MTSLSTDPLMVALVQGAGSLPMFLFGLPSGVLADIVDRRRYLIVAQCWMLLVAAALNRRPNVVDLADFVAHDFSHNWHYVKLRKYLSAIAAAIKWKTSLAQ